MIFLFKIPLEDCNLDLRLSMYVYDGSDGTSSNLSQLGGLITLVAHQHYGYVGNVGALWTHNVLVHEK